MKMGKDDSMTMRLVGEAEFEDANLSDASDDGERVELHKLKVTKGTFSTMSGFTQVVIFLMFWSVLIGVCMLSIHIVAREDPKRQKIILVALSGAWIILSNLIAFIVFIIDKFQAFNNQPRMSEALVQLLFFLGGVAGGWLALCLTCYKPPGFKTDKMSAFMCRAMIFSAIGLTIVIVFLLKILLPNLELLSV